MAFSNCLLEDGKSCSRGLQRDSVRRGFPHGIAQILGHPAQCKVRSEVIGSDSFCHSLHDSTTRSATCENGHGLGAVQTASIDHRHSFGKGRGLHSAKEIVDELHESAATDRAKMHDVATEHGKHRAGCVESFRGTSHKKN